MRGVNRELRIFTFIQRLRSQELGQKPSLKVIIKSQNRRQDGFPDLLGYKVGKGHGEIMMTNAGKPLTYWKKRLTDKSAR